MALAWHPPAPDALWADHGYGTAPRGVMTVDERPFHHVPVLLHEVIDWFAATPAGWIIDGTLGGGGHSEAILAAQPEHSILGIDRDIVALRAATARLARFGDRIMTVQARFDAMDGAVVSAGVGPIAGVLLDLGVSSVQFDDPDRGFSYRFDAELDMRMDRSESTTAGDLVNGLPMVELATVLRRYGDERFAERVAKAIVAARPITTTGRLAAVVTDAIPAATRRHGGHPAKRTFQALRIAVNSELDVLAPAIDAAIELLQPGGRLVVISYHSGEDRIVKHSLRVAETGGCTCPPGLPCVCGALPRGRSLTRAATRPRPSDIDANPRAASALARVFVRGDQP
jgi:16S rRNA (cytosine1402-N4)-methyltransferase